MNLFVLHWFIQKAYLLYFMWRFPSEPPWIVKLVSNLITRYPDHVMASVSGYFKYVIGAIVQLPSAIENHVQCRSSAWYNAATVRT